MSQKENIQLFIARLDKNTQQNGLDIYINMEWL